MTWLALAALAALLVVLALAPFVVSGRKSRDERADEDRRRVLSGYGDGE